jgi:hypothetical protein
LHLDGSSQPLASSPSQLRHPETHVPILHVPDEQVASACGKLHWPPHEPQLAVSFCVSTQMPLHSVSSGAQKSLVAMKSWRPTSAPLTETDRLAGLTVKPVSEGVTVELPLLRPEKA